MIRKTPDLISSAELEGGSSYTADDLLHPARGLQEQRTRRVIDGWLRQGVFEGATLPVADAMPRVKQDSLSRKRAAQKPAIPAEATPLEEQIRVLAYALFEQRGRDQGHDVEDWLRAEELIMSSRRRRDGRSVESDLN
jgi:hypothetical protein